MPVLVKCLGKTYQTLQQTALVLLLHLQLATKHAEDVEWLAIDCGFARKMDAMAAGLFINQMVIWKCAYIYFTSNYLLYLCVFLFCSPGMCM